MNVCIHGSVSAFDCFLCGTIRNKNPNIVNSYIDDAKKKIKEAEAVYDFSHKRILNDHADRINELIDKVKCIESRLSEAKVDNKSAKVDKKPHACPVCNGACEFKLLSVEAVIANNGNQYEQCKPCSGKGIVWG